MKTMRYLLMIIATASVLGLKAQNLAQFPEAKMHSTSIMVGSGSSLPQAAIEGVVTTYAANNSAYVSGPRRSRPGDNKEPYEDPLGDAVLPMMLMAILFAGFVYYRRKKKVKSLNR